MFGLSSISKRRSLNGRFYEQWLDIDAEPIPRSYPIDYESSRILCESVLLLHDSINVDLQRSGGSGLVMPAYYFDSEHASSHERDVSQVQGNKP